MMKKTSFTIVFIWLSLGIYAQSVLPYFNSMYYTKNDGIYKYNPTSNNSFPPVQQLNIGTKLSTMNGNWAFQAVGGYFTGIAFSSERGITVDFEYSIDQQDGSGNQYSANVDGGFAVNLLDNVYLKTASLNNTISNGYTLGYSYNRIYGSQYTNFTAGFLSFGFDPSGKYKKMLYEGDDWVTGIDFKNKTAPTSNEDFTIRGPWNPDYDVAIYDGSPARSGFTGNPVIFSRNVNTSLDNQYTINYSDGSYIGSSVANTGLPGIRGKKRDYNLDSDDRRRAVCSVVLGTNGVKRGYFLNVTIYHGLTPAVILKDFFIDPDVPLNYQEMLPSFKWTDKTLPPTEIKTLSMKLPSEMLLAFSGSTSQKTQSINSFIRNLNVYLPFSPNVDDMSVDNICMRRGKTTVINVLEQVTGYNSNQYNSMTKTPLPSKAYVDMESFCFYIKDQTNPGGFLGLSGQTSITTNYGDYTFDPKSGYIYFTYNPKEFNLDATQDIVYFNVKNKATVPTADVPNMGDQQFGSRIARLELNFVNLDDCPPDKYIIMNQVVSPRVSDINK